MDSRYDVIIIGAGAGGLVIAIGSARAGKKVLLIEKGHWGGDCTNFGCIPSKSLIASAHTAYAIKEGRELGVIFSSQDFTANEALKRVRNIIADVRSHEDSDALRKKGVDTLEGLASFVDPFTIKVNQAIVSAKKIIIATGSAPFIPPIEGLSTTPFLTNETVFSLKQIPRHLIVLGGGPIGCELAQAFSRLGARVTLIHTHTELLGKEDREAQDALAKQFVKEGIKLELGLTTQKVSYSDHFTLELSNQQKIQGDALLVATGRRPNVDSLNLKAAEIIYSVKGIPVDKYGRTNQKHIFAIGDVRGEALFTHNAEHQARAVLKSLLLPFNKKIDSQPIPRVTYTDPEIAAVGMTEHQALEKFKANQIAIYIVPFKEVDRAITAGRTEGFVKIITKKWSSQILGATLVAPRAGEMLMQISTAMYTKMPLRKFSSLIHPYPTFSLAIRWAADLWFTQTILPLFRHEKTH